MDPRYHGSSLHTSPAISTAGGKGGLCSGGVRLRGIPVICLLLSLLGTFPVGLEGQRIISYEESRRNQPIHEGLPEVLGGFTFCRLQYNQVRSMQRGLGWSTDYSGADVNLTLRLSELTPTWISKRENGNPGTAVVRATDPDLFQCPFLFGSDIGSAGFLDTEVEALREYLLKGGFLWVDDFWGDAAWNYWVQQVRRILPGYEIVDIPADHPLMSVVYQVRQFPQIPSMQFWRESGGAVSELGRESAEAHLRAVLDDDGHILILMSHNTDIADGWEREMDDDAFFQLFSPSAYAVGINVLILMMTR